MSPYSETPDVDMDTTATPESASTPIGPRPVLQVKDLTQDFGGLRALNELDLTVNEGEIVALIGPNGAGKTTFFNCVTGI